MNYAFAKIGKSVKFKKNKYSPVGGDNEASCLLRAVAFHNPDKTFYIIGRSDFDKLTPEEKLDLFPNKNVEYVWENAPRWKTVDENYFNYITNYFRDNNITITNTIMMVGNLCGISFPNKIRKLTNPNEFCGVLESQQRYAAPIVKWINDTNARYVEIVNDPRYTMAQLNDCFYPPKVSLGQYDYSYNCSHITEYVNQNRIDTKVDSEYAGMETLFCYDYDQCEVNTNRNTDMMIILNEGNPSRYKLLKEWILNSNSNVEVYGKWKDTILEKDNRFKGSLHIDEIQKKLQDVKYTFIIPIRPGWVTSKYIEMLHAGVLPFFHPTYDDQKHIKVPSILRPNTPHDLSQATQYLNDNKDEYIKLLNNVRQDILKEKYYNGSFINKQIMKGLDR